MEGDPGQEPGTFVSSEPGSGSEVDAGSVVTYHLAKAPAATPTEPTRPTPSLTVPSTPWARDKL